MPRKCDFLNFWPKFRFLTKITFFCQNFNFWTNMRFSDHNYHFWSKCRFLDKHAIFGQNFDFLANLRFSVIISIFGETFDFPPKFRFFCANLRFMLKFSTKNRTNAPFSDVTLFRYTVYVTIKVIAAAKRLRLPEVVIFIFRLSPESRSLSHQML